MSPRHLAACVLLAAACAPARFALVPASSYGPRGEQHLTADQRELLGNVAETLKRAGHAAELVPDQAAAEAAQALADQLVERQGVLPTDGYNMLLTAGIADRSWAFTTVWTGFNDRVPRGKLLESMADLGLGSSLRIGVADLRDAQRSRHYWAIVLVDREVELGTVPRRVEPGARIEITGRALHRAKALELWLGRPDGSWDARRLAVGSDGTFRESLELAGQGTYAVEILARPRGRDRVLAVLPIGVGQEPGRWPPEAVDIAGTTPEAIESAVLKLLEAAHGRPLGSSPALSAIAKACVSGTTRDCASPRDVAWSRVVGSGTYASNIERIVADLLALPHIRAALKDERVNAAAVSVLPPSGAGKLYRVSLVLAGDGGPEATRSSLVASPRPDSAAQGDEDAPAPPAATPQP